MTAVPIELPDEPGWSTVSVGHVRVLVRAGGALVEVLDGDDPDEGGETGERDGAGRGQRHGAHTGARRESAVRDATERSPRLAPARPGGARRSVSPALGATR